MILILTGPDDAHADAVAEQLQARAVAFARLDPADLAGAASMSARYDRAGLTGRIVRAAGSTLDLDAVTAVWWRRPGRPGEPAAIAGTTAGAVARDELQAVTWDLLDTLDARGVRILPAPFLITHRAQGKLRQLALAGELGFQLPPTVVTNNPDEVLEFAARHIRVITKLASPGLPISTADGASAFRYTDVLRPFDLVNVDAVGLCPMIIQAYVPKRSELRVTIVGDRVMAAEIDSQGTHHTRDDWRRYDNGHTGMTPHDLPADLVDRCVAMTRSLGLCYGAMDLVLTPEGEYVFLEINPSGQYLWVEAMSGLPITAAIADYLCGVAANVPASA